MTNTRPQRGVALAGALLFFFGGAAAGAQGTSTQAKSTTDAIAREPSWPLTVRDGDTTLTVHQPQIDSWDGFTLEGRVAVGAAVGAQNPQLVYGVVWLSTRTLTDKGTRVVTIDQAKVVSAEFPSVSAEYSQRWAAAIARDFAGKSRTVALDRLEAQLSIAHTARNTQQQPLRNEPPRIVFAQTPSILVSIDGKPEYRAMAGTAYQRVINTRPLLLRDANGAHYLRVFDGWLTANALQGPWSVSNPSSALEAAFKQASDARLVDPLTGQTTPDHPAPSLKEIVPGLVVAVAPTELIVTDGPLRYVGIPGTGLQYANNTTGNVFRDGDNQIYVLTTGRWFRAPGEQGPWQFVPANKLPADFWHIPDDSPKENVKASVAATSQALEAAISASIPQTAAVKVSGTRLSPPKFDGEPKFVSITSNLEYIANTATPMVRVYGQTCYAVENGVWFVAASPQGPWSVALQVPSVIYSIPPSSPLYYVTFVRIYNVTGDTVYQGYTPGYQGTYVDPETGVVVFGTGYDYESWIGELWFGAPETYGMAAAVTYTPWTGWAVAYGIGWTWDDSTPAMGWGWGAYPWWGPWGWGWAWGPPYYPWYPAWGVGVGSGGGMVAWGPGGWAGYTGNIYQNWGNRATVWHGAGGYNAWTGNAWASKAGISYNSRTGVASAGQRGAVGNVYSGNFATGSRGVAVGPEGGAVVGRHGTAGNIYSGNTVSGGKGAYYNPNTGEWTQIGAATGEGGRTVAKVGDNVYAGSNGNVYRRTDNGWEQYTPSGGWQQPPASREAAATREATGGLGSTRAEVPATNPEGREQSRDQFTNRSSMSSERREQLDRDHDARRYGNERANQVRNSSQGMNRAHGGRVGGGGRRR